MFNSGNFRCSNYCKIIYYGYEVFVAILHRFYSSENSHLWIAYEFRARISILHAEVHILSNWDLQLSTADVRTEKLKFLRMLLKVNIRKHKGRKDLKNPSPNRNPCDRFGPCGPAYFSSTDFQGYITGKKLKKVIRKILLCVLLWYYCWPTVLRIRARTFAIMR